MVECDVLVVGAGPAGSSAARAAALNGAKTIFIDKKKEVGVPVQCAEGIGRYLFPYLPFKIPKKLLKWPIEGISFWADDITIERKGDNWAGYSINRDEFDKWLTDKAIKAGANLMLKTELVDLEIEGDYNIKKATVETPNGNREIIPKVVIAADGVDSTVLKLLGFEIHLEKNAGYVLGYEIDGVNIKAPHYEQIFMGDFAPGGYGYIFPKSRTVANVGVAILFEKNNIVNYFEDFINVSNVSCQIKNSKIIRTKSGWAPIKYPTRKWRYGNVLLAGDSANQNFKPLVEGILPSIICGDIAGLLTFNHISYGKSLETYEATVKKKLSFSISDMLTDTLYELGKLQNNKSHIIRLGFFSNYVDINELESIETSDYEEIKRIILKRNKRIENV